MGLQSACNAEDTGSIPGPGRSPGEGNSNLPQLSCLGNPMDREAKVDLWAKVDGVAKESTTTTTLSHIHSKLIYWYMHNIYKDILGMCILIMFPH